MLIHEEFARCTKCDNPYFRKNTYVLLKKKENPYSDSQEYGAVLEYICSKCGHLYEKVEQKDSL